MAWGALWGQLFCLGGGGIYTVCMWGEEEQTLKGGASAWRKHLAFTSISIAFQCAVRCELRRSIACWQTQLPSRMVEPHWLLAGACLLSPNYDAIHRTLFSHLWTLSNMWSTPARKAGSTTATPSPVCRTSIIAHGLVQLYQPAMKPESSSPYLLTPLISHTIPHSTQP